MKKNYIQPETTIVNVNLIGSVLDDPNIDVYGPSYVTNDGDAKSNDILVDDDEDLVQKKVINGNEAEMSFDSKWSFE